MLLYSIKLLRSEGCSGEVDVTTLSPQVHNEDYVQAKLEEESASNQEIQCPQGRGSTALGPAVRM
jgi:hypothetical protein